MANMLKVNVRLREMHLAHYDIRDFGATRLKEGLLDNLTLTHLDVSRSVIPPSHQCSCYAVQGGGGACPTC